MRMRSSSILVAAALLGASAGSAHAAPTLRVQVDQHGDFLLIGNTIGFECAGGTPAPVVGTIATGACTTQTNNNDSAPDLLWRSDAPANGQALASGLTTPAQARSTAVLTIPNGATVTHAFLYWGATNANGVPDNSVVLERPGSALNQTLTAVKTFPAGTNNAYQAVADVTAIVQQFGAGAYRVSDIDVVQFAGGQNNSNIFGGWSMVVFYQRAADPLRNLALFEGMDVVSNGNNQTITLSGFLVPNAGYNGKLGVIAYEGDNTLNGDSLLFNNVVLTDALNPANNFFNGTRSNLGAAVSVAGDLPQLTGTAQSMAGIDLDVIDITAQLTPGQTSAPVQATSMGDTYYLGAWITSISTYKPDFSTSTKASTDVNGGTLVAGDTLQYTINVVNTGNDASVNTVLTDPLPMGVTYVPGSLAITAGPNTGMKTDATGDDQGDYNVATRTVTVRLGTGANATMGGTLPINGTTTVTFQVKIDAGFSGNLANQANINAAGALGAPNSTTPTDGNGPAAGSPPTTVVVDQCVSNADCGVPTPVCDTAGSPKTCVACLVDMDCGGAASGKVCTPGHTCVDGCRGMNGNGCPMTAVCTSMDATIGQCVQCLQDSHCGGTMSGKVCDTATDTCIDGCRGTGGNGCPTTASCTSMDATIGQCVECLQDSDCGGVNSGKVCDAATNKCVDGCRGTGGNGCPVGDECTSMDASIGQCVDCLQDSDCGGATSGKVCDVSTHLCIDGCRGMSGNGCPSGQDCTSTDTTIGQCVECLQDSDCGGGGSGKVCDATTSKCVDGCRGTVEGICPTGEVCTSMDASIGQCVQCLQDSDCGGAMSGKVCDASTNMCVDGCRGTGGNGCPASQTCTSTDTTIGKCATCTTDADCGGATSGKVCDDTTKTCVDGCRGALGNACADDKHCTSKDETIGKCVDCTTDSDCGDVKSGKVCDATTSTCVNGCRGTGGNRCRTGETCSSTDGTIGQCTGGGEGGGGGALPSGVVPEGNGILCAARPGAGDDDGAAWLVGAALAALAGARRRRRG